MYSLIASIQDLQRQLKIMNEQNKDLLKQLKQQNQQQNRITIDESVCDLV